MKIKGYWELYHLCNCKVRLAILSLSNNGIQRYNTIRESKFAMPNNVWTNIQPVNLYHQRVQYVRGLFVQRNTMTFTAGVVHNSYVKEGSTFKTLYSILC